MKKCSKCSLDKDESEFNIRKSAPDGLAYQCKECNKANLKDHYHRNKAKYIQRNNTRRKRIKSILKRYKVMKGCAKCGYKKHHAALHFHHLYDKLFTLARLPKCWSWKKIKVEVKKCKILCANCHAEEHWTE